MNHHHTYNWFQMITPNSNWVCRPLRQLSPNLISIIKISNFSSAIQTKCTIHAFLTLYWRERTPYELTNEHVYNSVLNGTPFQMTSRRTQQEPTPTFQLTGTPVQISLRRSNQIWIEHTKYQHRLNKPDARSLMQAQLYTHRKIKCSLRLQHFTSTWSSTLHLYVKSKSASAVNSREPKYTK